MKELNHTKYIQHLAQYAVMAQYILDIIITVTGQSSKITSQGPGWYRVHSQQLSFLYDKALIIYDN